MVFSFLSLLLGEVENDLFLIVGVEEELSLSEAIMRAIPLFGLLGLVNLY